MPRSRLFTTGPAATGRPVSGRTAMRWRRHPRARAIRPIAASGRTTKHACPDRLGVGQIGALHRTDNMTPAPEEAIMAKALSD